MVSRVFAALMLLPLGSCGLWHGTATPGARADCPAVTQASAWIDAMPSVGPSPQRMIVVVKLDDDRPWLLTPVTSGSPDVLVLALSPGGPAVAGNASYREPATRRRNAVSILCGGAESARIDEITIVM